MAGWSQDSGSPHTAPHPGLQGWSLGPLITLCAEEPDTIGEGDTAVFMTLGVLQAQKHLNQQPVAYKTDTLFSLIDLYFKSERHKLCRLG